VGPGGAAPDDADRAAVIPRHARHLRRPMNRPMTETGRPPRAPPLKRRILPPPPRPLVLLHLLYLHVAR
jgi:hypothetical protein